MKKQAAMKLESCSAKGENQALEPVAAPCGTGAHDQIQSSGGPSGRNVDGAWLVAEHKGTWWMSWHQEATKDARTCDKPRGAGN